MCFALQALDSRVFDTPHGMGRVDQQQAVDTQLSRFFHQPVQA
jgi:hypothetical protein